MFETLKRWKKNLAWLFNHPATNIVYGLPVPPCGYCGAETPVWNFDGYLTICYPCMKKVCDKVLKEDKK